MNPFLTQVLDQEAFASCSPSTSLGSSGSSPASSFSTSPWQTAGTTGAAAKQSESYRKRSSAASNSVDPIEEKLARLTSPSKPDKHGPGGESTGVVHSSSSVCVDADEEDDGAPPRPQPTADRKSHNPTSATDTVDLIDKKLLELKSPSKGSAGATGWYSAPCKPSCACAAHAFDEEVRPNNSGLLALKGPEASGAKNTEASDGAAS